MTKVNRPWDAEEEQIIRDMLDQQKSARDIAAKLVRPLGSVQNKITRMGIGPVIAPRARMSRVVRDDAEVRITAPEETGAEPAADFLARVLKQTGAAVKKATAEPYVTLRVASDKPIAINLSSDWHLSPHSACDVQGVLDLADTVRQTPGMYAIAFGDMTDNPIKHKPTSVVDIPDEHRLLDIVLGRFGGKLLGTTSGNHDDWTRTFVGIDNLKTMAEKHRIHYAPDELIWSVEIVDPSDLDTVTAKWVIATRHKFYRHSNLNFTHACWRWAEDRVHNWPILPDVYALGHNHVAAVEHRTYETGVKIAVRTGAWQKSSAFTRAGGWTLQPPTAPTVILPNVRDGIQQPHAFDDYRQAVEALKAKQAA